MAPPPPPPTSSRTHRSRRQAPRLLSRPLLSARLSPLLLLPLLSCSLVRLLHVASLQDDIAPPPPQPTAPTYLYKVYLNTAPPVSLYRGGVAGFPATAGLSDALKGMAGGLRGAARRARQQMRRGPLRDFAKFLGQVQRKVADDVKLPMSKVLYSYKYVSNGFAARLTLKQVQQLRRHPQVAAVKASRRIVASTTHSPAFLNLPGTLWPASGGVDAAGEDVIVGVIDSGIWPEHPSFTDNGTQHYGPPPARWAGRCELTKDFRQCSRKVIGARFFACCGVDASVEYWSARDAAGHGSWCAGAAAGNNGVMVAGPNGGSFGAASGMAPRARLAVYKALWKGADGTTAGETVDIEAAIDAAVADGVDVLSMSFGDLGMEATYLSDGALLNAAQANVVLVMAGGNEGPPPTYYNYRSLTNVSPFYLTVGASTIGRQYHTELTLGNGVSLKGVGVGGNADTAAGLGIISGAQAVVEGGDADKAQQCFDTMLDPSKVANKIVVCDRGVTTILSKVSVVASLGGAAMVLANVASSPSTTVELVDGATIPTLHVSLEQAAVIMEYLDSADSPTATLAAIAEPAAAATPAPAVTYFSSTGPVAEPSSTPRKPYPTNDILKPDIIAPGFNLWAAGAGSSLATRTTPVFSLLSGTSMATPHMAGIAALVVQNHPDWSPAQVMSAILTTASTTNTAGGPILNSLGQPATPWEMGAGHVNPGDVLDPGLTFDASFTDYLSFLSGQAGKVSLKSLGLGKAAPRGLKAIPAYNLNRPAISVSRLLKTVTVTRFVTNVADANSTYTAKVVPPANVKVVVKPLVLSVAAGKTASFTVQFTVTKASSQFSFGSLTWEDQAGHVVRSVLAVQPVKK
ncbi:hypothetical protein CLOM_g24013 [Closterium sp. NIES-68]|nr:hypothetical protein CLOM_g24013 [Closterium sp. NIES-68]GJP80961.1 hypothetical protein CLOP_g11152 [Closterium sp. NIES-67]